MGNSGVMNGFVNMSFGKGTVTLYGGSSSWTVNFIGSSCQASAPAGAHDLTSVTFTPAIGKREVVALCMVHADGKSGVQWICGLVGLTLDGDKIHVDLGFPFERDRLGQVTADGKLTVTTEGQRFFYSEGFAENTRRHLSKEPEQCLLQGVRLVNSPNLLCRYLVGQADIRELEAAASGDMRTAEQIRLANVQAELREANADLIGGFRQREDLQKSLDAERKAYAACLQTCTGLFAEKANLQSQLATVKSQRDDLSTQLQIQAELTSFAKAQRAVHKVDETVQKLFAKWMNRKSVTEPVFRDVVDEVKTIRLRRPYRSSTHRFLSRLWCRALSKE